MKKYLFLFLFALCFLFSVSAFALSTSTYVMILPGYFSLSISGDLQSGISLSGLKPADDSTFQVGYWNSDKNFDYLYFYDSSNIPGFRIQMYLDGPFQYIGSSTLQSDIPVSGFSLYSGWDPVLNVGIPPDVGVDDFTKTVNINGQKSCKPDDLIPYSNYYQFPIGFSVSPFRVNFSNESFNYLVSSNSCSNEGKLYLGRFQLDLGVVKAGEYRSSLYIIMLDGY